jgi:hypothetical protein
MFHLLLAAGMILPPVQQLAVAPASEPAPIRVSNREADENSINHDLLYLRAANGPRFPGITITVVLDTAGSVVSALALPENQEKDTPPALLVQAEAMVRGLKFRPFYRNGHPVSVSFERYVNTLPLELMPAQHVPFPEVQDWNSIKIILERTVCFGNCPSYKIELHGDGTVLYEGRAFVAVTGSQRASVPKASIIELVKLFEQADYYSLLSQYKSRITDNPTQTTSIEIDGQRKQVVDYLGLYVGMPLSVMKLEEAIDRLSGDARWVHGPSAR